MLTNMYYYNFYRPYMIKNISGPDSSTVTRRKKTIATSKGENLSFQLNKALKTDVIHYAKDMTKYFVGLKDSSKHAARDMDELKENIYEKGFDTAKSWIEEDLAEFAEGINQTLDFADRQQHSQVIKDFSQKITDTLMDRAKELSTLGFQQDQDGRFFFQKEQFENMTPDSLNNAIDDNIDTFRKVYDQTVDILSIPMSEHMNFKSLNYYYNYRLGNLYNDTFKIIETGMIVDAVI